MSQPAYVSGVWITSRLSISQHQLRQLVRSGDFPPSDLILGRSRLWRLAELVRKYPGLADDGVEPVRPMTSAK